MLDISDAGEPTSTATRSSDSQVKEDKVQEVKKENTQPSSEVTPRAGDGASPKAKEEDEEDERSKMSARDVDEKRGHHVEYRPMEGQDERSQGMLYILCAN